MKQEKIRIWRSFRSAFGEFTAQSDVDLANDESYTSTDAYTDAELERIATEGFNGIWVHGQINNIVHTDVFPELGKRAEEIQQRMNTLINRAEKHGVKVYLYMQIPRGLPENHPFWKIHPECGGLPDWHSDAKGKPILMRPMCTSVPKVQEYLQSAGGELASKLSRLAGVFLITASEYISHCYGRNGRVIMDEIGAKKVIPVDCPLCSKRKSTDVIAEFINIFTKGVHGVNPDFRVTAWNWAWDYFEADPCSGIIDNLDPSVCLLVDFERGGHRKDGSVLREYSLGYPGPSERFQAFQKKAEEQKRPVFAKLQFGTTHELAVVPNLPAMESVRLKAKYMAESSVAGFWGCWNFGNMPSANTAGFRYFYDHPEGTLEEFAASYFSGCDAAKIAEGWRICSKALSDFPNNNPFLYFGPMNFSPKLPFEPGPHNGREGRRSWLPDANRGDDLSHAFTDKPAEMLISEFENFFTEWSKGAAVLKEALKSGTSAHAKEEYSSICGSTLLFQAAVHAVKLHILKKNWTDSCMAEYKKLAVEELTTLEALADVVRNDSRIGYHIEAHTHLFTIHDIEEKICRLAQQRLSVDALLSFCPDGKSSDRTDRKSGAFFRCSVEKILKDADRR